MSSTEGELYARVRFLTIEAKFLPSIPFGGIMNAAFPEQVYGVPGKDRS